MWFTILPLPPSLPPSPSHHGIGGVTVMCNNPKFLFYLITTSRVTFWVCNDLILKGIPVIWGGNFRRYWGACVVQVSGWECNIGSISW